MFNLLSNLNDLVSNFLVKLLNKFKFQNPIVYGIVATLIVYVGIQMEAGNIVIPSIAAVDSVLAFFGIPSLNSFVFGVLVAVGIAIAPHTEKKVEDME